MSILVSIFEDNKALLESFIYLINSTKGLALAGAHDNANKVLENIADEKPDVVLMDIEMAGINGIAATALIKKQFPEIQILIQTIFEDDDKVFNALCAGASGYLLKNTSPAMIVQAIEEVYNGGAPMSPSIASKVVQSFHKKPLEEGVSLTEREQQVLQYLTEGKSYKMIAAAMNIGYGTVHVHLKHIYQKLHVNSMSEAVARALRDRLV